ncbi:MAG TPA: 2-C-methyl-D-erythritol 4-phosphate cytidylyltransferase [Gammaproteobacteria bacterium]|nr:2-C-methyl-D-erythritol 4-phosphate cytidylyltransferase [Gammaproteobacteria bacterium]
MNLDTRLWGVLPAAGIGRRMGSEVPKQYLTLHGRTVLGHAIARLADHPDMAGVVVAIAADDPYWPQAAPDLAIPVETVTGGGERCHSVLHALERLAGYADPDDWVLVHDAARPCLPATDLARLVAAVRGHPGGGLLAQRMHDTVKRAVAGGDEVAETVDRSRLWRAQTPQMFRLGALRAALRAALDAGTLVTDESSAMEAVGDRPLLVEGSPENIKVTRPEDLALAGFYLGRDAGHGTGEPERAQ